MADDVIYQPPRALIRLITHFRGKHGSTAMACSLVSEKLKWQWGSSHIYKVARGSSPATPKFRERIDHLAYNTFNPERYWLTIQALTKDQRDRWKQVPMEERRKALDKIYYDFARNNLPCDPIKPCYQHKQYGPGTIGVTRECNVHEYGSY